MPYPASATAGDGRDLGTAVGPWRLRVRAAGQMWQPYAPAVLGSERTGPDLSNVGARQASEVWQYLHLYNPRSVVEGSIMPAFPWLFDVKAVAGRWRISRAPAGSLRTARAASSCRTRAGGRWWPTCWPGVRSRSRATEGRADAGRSVHHHPGATDRRSPPSRLTNSPSRRHTMRWHPRTRGSIWLLVAAGVIAVVVTTFYTLLYLIRPGETSEHAHQTPHPGGRTRGIPMTEEQQHDIDVSQPAEPNRHLPRRRCGAIAEHDSALELRTGYLAAWRTDRTPCGSRPTTTTA